MMKRYLRFLILIAVIFLSGNNYLISQSVVDSILLVLDQTHEIDKKVEVYLSLGQAYEDIDLDKAISNTKKALELAEKTNLTTYLGLIYTYLGEFSILQDSIIKGEIYFHKAKDYLVNNNNPKELISIYLSIGNRFVEKDNYADAMKYYLNAIDISKQSGYINKLPSLYNNLGIVYLNTNNTEKALNLYSQALELFKDQNDTMNIAGTTTNIGSIYIQLGQYEISRTYYKTGYELFSESNNIEGMAHSLFKIGLLDILQKKYANAINRLNESIDIQKDIDITYSGSKSFFLAETYINIGIAYLQINKYENARINLIEGYKIASATNQYRLIALSAEYLSSYFKTTEEYKTALEYYQVFKQYSDSIFNEESIRQLTQTEMRHEFNTKLKERELLGKIEVQKEKRKNLIYILISVGLLLLLVIVGLLLRLENTRKRKIELEKKNLSTKLEHTNKELTTYVMYLLRKNEFIISIAEKLKVVRLDAKVENKKIMTELIKELESNSTMISWEEFEVRFQQVYTGFYKKLNQDYPDLTPNELRLCAFFRLNMTTKEIAAITYQSINSITVARYRLRKKLDLSSDNNLVTFLTTL